MSVTLGFQAAGLMNVAVYGPNDLLFGIFFAAVAIREIGRTASAMRVSEVTGGTESSSVTAHT